MRRRWLAVAALPRRRAALAQQIGPGRRRDRSRSASPICSPRCSRSCSRRAAFASIGGRGSVQPSWRFARSGTAAIDVYPEYTGTGLLVLLGEPPRGTAADVYARVAEEFPRRFGVRWLPPLGFENTYAIAVRKANGGFARLATRCPISRVWASRLARRTHARFHRTRRWICPDLSRRTGFDFATCARLLPAVKYRALDAGDVDVVDGYSTDGLIARYRPSRPDRRRALLPALRGSGARWQSRLARTNPAAVAALTELSGRIDVEHMRALNRRVEVEGAPIAARGRGGARRAWARIGALTTVRHAPRRSELASVDVSCERREQRCCRSRAAPGARRRVALLRDPDRRAPRADPRAEGVERGAGDPRASACPQTLPGIALLAFMIPVAGHRRGAGTRWRSCFTRLYPIVRNTFTGVRDADPSAVDAARALGMTDGQILRQVRLPLAAPVIMAGIRTAAVIDVGTATLAAFIGAGGLGEPIVSGLALSDTRMILSGAIPAALLALAVDATLAGVERFVRPRSLTVARAWCPSAPMRAREFCRR